VKRHDVVRSKCLHIAIHFKSQNRLRSAQVSSLQHAAIFQFQRVRKPYSGEKQRSSRCNQHFRNVSCSHLPSQSPLSILRKFNANRKRPAQWKIAVEHCV